jgi:glycosyltransferase involved in cell wall biosynthesis
VVIPTYNGGELFKRVLERAAGQQAPFDHEVLVIDSASTDGTAEFARGFGGRVQLHVIDKADFQHGRTRNLAVSLTNADRVAFLTQDALPADEHWLARLTGGFELGSKVAAVTGSHRAYPEHGVFAEREITAHFDRLHDYGQVLSLARGLPSFIYPGGHQWQDALQFYSDNNSCLLRAAWEILPYPEIEWGEDQLWAWRLLQLGFEKAYVHEAAVLHSHAHTSVQEAEVAEAAGWFWKRWFGRGSYGSEAAAEAAVLRTNEQDIRYARERGASPAAVEARAAATRAAVFGRLQGALRAERELSGQV